MSERFNSVQAVRLYLRDSVVYSISNDEFLHKLFYNEDIDPILWCNNTMSRMGEWGKTIDKLILSYFSGFWISIQE